MNSQPEREWKRVNQSELLRKISERSPGRVWVVGGAVRDRLLGRAPADLDLVIGEGESEVLKPEFWRQEGAAACWLDQQRQMLRLTSSDGMTTDISPLLREGLSADLARRDFTLNAMAWPLQYWEPAGGQCLIDPVGGRQDLAAHLLRLVRPDALEADPARVLRAARLIIQLQLIVDEATLQALSQAAPLLARVPGERVWQELSRIFLHPAAPLALEYLAEWGAVSALFPEAEAMRDIEQNQYHQFTVDEHSQRAFLAFVEIAHQGKYLTDTSRQLAERYYQQLEEREQAALMLAAWLHDIGKPSTRAISKGKVTFYNHEHVGAGMAEKVGERLRLSRDQTRLIHTFISYHMYLMQLWRTGHLDERLIHRFYRRTGLLGVGITLFTLADHLAKGENISESEEFRQHQAVVERLLTAYYCQHEQVVAPLPLLRGDDIAKIGGKPAGPWVGHAKDALLEAQATGQVADRQQALEFIRDYLTRERDW
jgi:putative nucleotidyltransferase with HDIG domain